MDQYPIFVSARRWTLFYRNFEHFLVLHILKEKHNWREMFNITFSSKIKLFEHHQSINSLLQVYNTFMTPSHWQLDPFVEDSHTYNVRLYE